MPHKTPIQKLLPLNLDTGALLDWYDASARTLPWRVGPAARGGGMRPDPYRVWLSEVMLQQTTVAAVVEYYLHFTRRWPSVGDLAEAPLDDVLGAWAGLGYYARARNLHACARAVATRLGGVFPQSSAELMTLPGIGPYTAAAIAAICHDEKVPVLDGNVERVLARVLALNVPVRDAKPQLCAALSTRVPERAGDFAQAMMDLGATLCAPRRALCDRCPLSGGCRAFGAGRPLDFPVKPTRAQRPTRHGHAFVIVNNDGAVWLRQRPDKGLLASMTEVPGSTWDETPTPPAGPLAADWRPAGHVTHVFTHFRLELDVWAARSDEAPASEGWWASPREVARAALPSLYRKVLAVAGVGQDKAQKKTAGHKDRRSLN
ncbi:MAG TPA: A/G-specific adenine glycosylase [Devosiaceae bacterium]